MSKTTDLRSKHPKVTTTHYTLRGQIMANVILSEAEFKRMTERIQDQHDRIKELEAGIKFLNDQIEQYNDEFSNGDR